MNIKFKNREYSSILDNLVNNQNIDKDNICAICREPLLVDTIKLNCNHRYHSTCLINSFIKYESKKCPLCNEYFSIDYFKTKCQRVLKNKNICNKTCYNNEGLCSMHSRLYLIELQKEDQKNKKLESSIKKKINTNEKKILKLDNEIKKLKNEINSLNDQLIKLK
jgi:hypothetical protein